MDYTNNLDILRRIDNMMAINNTVAVDLLGQMSCGFTTSVPFPARAGFSGSSSPSPIRTTANGSPGKPGKTA